MSATPDSTLDDPQQTIADLKRQLAESNAERDEALTRETATAEVLQVINSSLGDLNPVFDAILEKARSLCGAVHGALVVYDGEHFRAVATHGLPEPLKGLLCTPFPANPVHHALLRGERLIHIADQAAVRTDTSIARASVDAGARTLLLVPLRKDGALLGYITASRREVRPFSDKQIALVENFAAQAVIAMENARLITETSEALEQQTATAEVLGVINSSPGDLAPVFDAMLEKATRLCEAAAGTFWVSDGHGYRAAAIRGMPEAFVEIARSYSPGPDTPVARIARGEGLVHLPDIAADNIYASGDALVRSAVDGGIRTLLSVPLQKGSDPLGVFSIYRREVRAFSEKQIALVQNFAAQAVIAIENARLIAETREALEQQTATAEVLGVINASPGDLAPVFEAMLEKATRLCEGDQGLMWTFDGENFRAAALRGVSPEFADFLRQPLRPAPGLPLGRVMCGESLVNVADMKLEQAYRDGEPLARAATDLADVRTLAVVGLTKDEKLLGAFAISRREVRPFTNKQIALLQNFAAQAVIAMENARLITETREALEQQTATAEVLGVINSSPGDLQPVFDAMLDKALRLCDAVFGNIRVYDGSLFHHAAARGASAQIENFHRGPLASAPSSPLETIIGGETMLHFSDLRESDAYKIGTPGVKTLVEVGGVRSWLIVALRKDGVLLGFVSVYRQEVRPFTDKQIALLQNFAAQAVIAMENARLITETREALEQQTATAEVLGVINSSPGDLAPVFDAMLEKALRLCNASFGILATREGEGLQRRAARNLPPAFSEYLTQQPPDIGRRTFVGRALRERVVIHVADILAEEPYREGVPVAVATYELAGARTMLWVPLVKDDDALGVFTIYRTEVRPFSDKQIALLQNFAAQAVIAIENARLITETREALEQQTATAEVLGVINSSPGDLAPVFDAMLEKAHALCGVEYGTLQLYDGEKFRAVAMRGFAEPIRELLRQPYAVEPNSPLRDMIDGESLVEIPDILEHHAQAPNPRSEAAIAVGMRSLLFLALRRDNHLLGLISAARRAAGPFSEKEIALLQNFAAQAVIAMENARLITETREALEQQTATAEVLGVINSSPGDLAPVFDAMLDKATGLSNAAFGILWTFDGECFHAVAFHHVPRAYVEFLRDAQKASPVSALGRVASGEAFAHIPDLAADEYMEQGGFLVRQGLSLGGFRTVLAVPMRKDGSLLGVITIYRREVQPFADKQIALLQNFAAQAVIAMENARLITETREALEQQTATAEVLGVINSSPGNLAPVFDTILENAQKVCGLARASLQLYDGSQFRAVAVRGVPEAWANVLRTGYRPGDRAPMRRIIAGDRFVHIRDVSELSDPMAQSSIERGGARTLLCVPLRREDRLLGAITAGREEVRPFSDKEIALLESFATQAAIAIENARLLDEIRQRQAELRVTFDNMVDGVAMFDEELRLAAWNRNFQQILDLPNELLAERPNYADYLRILAERGEFGSDDIEAELSRRLEHMDQELRIERTRPDGRIVEVRRNSVPDGGFVLIYSDITERKRSEAEIRAARDAAESALRDLRAAQASLIQAEKMASLGQLTAGIAHEIKNPLNFVNNFAGLSVDLLGELKETAEPGLAALDENKRSEVDETIELLTGNLQKIAEHGKRADNIVKSMLEHSRGVSGERREVDLNGLVDEALNLAYHGARAQDATFNITMERDLDKSLAPIELAPQEISRVFLNLFSNGFHAATARQRQGGEPGFKPTLHLATRDLGDAIEVRVRDNGTGIPLEIRDKLFQPFFTTKPTGEGTGLGLSISYDIVTQQHGGTITVESEPGQFTEFTVRLPRTQVGRAAA